MIETLLRLPEEVEGISPDWTSCYVFVGNEQSRILLPVSLSTQMFTAALFVIAKNWNQPECLLSKCLTNLYAIAMPWNTIQQKRNTDLV